MLATLTLLTPALDLLLPIGRFGGLIWPVVASVLLPTGRDHAALHAVTGQIERLRIEAAQTDGPVELLAVVAGGSGAPASITELSLNDWRHTLDANLTTAFLTLRAFLPSMIERQRGSVVTMSSTAGRLPSPSSRPMAPPTPGCRCSPAKLPCRSRHATSGSTPSLPARR